MSPFDNMIRDHLALHTLGKALERAPMTQTEAAEVQQAYGYLKQRLTPGVPKEPEQPASATPPAEVPHPSGPPVVSG